MSTSQQRQRLEHTLQREANLLEFVLQGIFRRKFVLGRVAFSPQSS